MVKLESHFGSLVGLPLKKTFPHTLQGRNDFSGERYLRVNCIDSVVELTYRAFLDYDKTVNYNIKYVKNYHHTIH